MWERPSGESGSARVRLSAPALCRFARIVGHAARGSGPLGQAVAGQGSSTGSEPPGAGDLGAVRRVIDQDFGKFEVGCTGPVARGLSATAAADTPWRVVRFEPGPDDDVEAEFRSRDEVVDLEVFCNRGRPTVAELDRSQITDGR